MYLNYQHPVKSGSVSLCKSTLYSYATNLLSLTKDQCIKYSYSNAYVNNIYFEYLIQYPLIIAVARQTATRCTGFSLLILLKVGILNIVGNRIYYISYLLRLY